ncbi:TPA: hypothetical protein DF272_05810 [Candidatus Falkowbacteria bacterium]|nr:hypothetical protein [Candidatus Falkowbacteria bacterium]
MKIKIDKNIYLIKNKDKSMGRKIILTGLILMLSVTLTGCISFGKKETAAGSGVGAVATGDRGDTWVAKYKLMTPGAIEANIGGVNVTTIEMDPTDTNAIYMGTRGNGLYYSYNGGDGWDHADVLSKVAAGQINSISIDAKDKCSVYAAVTNRVVKTSDCNRTWQQVFNTAKADEAVVDVVVDWFNTSIVYAAAKDGSVYQSANAGASWAKLADVEQEIKELEISSKDSRVLFMTTVAAGLYKSTDGGKSWLSMNERMESLGGKYRNGYAVAVSKNNPGKVFYLSRLGLLQSFDNGETWSKIALLTGENEATFNALDVSVKDDNLIFLVSGSTLYRTVNGGQTWETRKLPSTAILTDLDVHLANDKLLFVGFSAPQK